MEISQRGRWLKVTVLLAAPAILLCLILTKRAEQTKTFVIPVTSFSVVDSISLLAFNDNDKGLMIFTSQGVQQWDVATKRKLASRPRGAQHSFPPPSPPFLSSDHQILLTSDRDNRDRFYVKLWDTHSGAFLRSIQVSDSMQYQRGAAMSPDGILATHNWAKPGLNPDRMYYGEQVKIWNGRSGALLHLIQLPGLTSQASTTVSCIAISDDGNRVAAGLQEGYIWLWDAHTGNELAKWKDASQDVLTGQTANSRYFTIPGIYQVAFSPDSKILATASGDDTVRLWDTKTRNPLHTFKTSTGQERIPMLFSPDSRLLAVASHRRQSSALGEASLDGQVWNVKTGQLAATLTDNDASINAFTFSSNSKVLASGDDKGNVKLWALE